MSACAYNSRGDVVSRTDEAGDVEWQASYEAFGKQTATFGTTAEKQTANSKDEDLSGLLNEGMRYRDLEAGVFLTRDPAGFVDGPNVYTYVRQNPWTKFDPLGLSPGCYKGKCEMRKWLKSKGKSDEDITRANEDFFDKPVREYGWTGPSMMLGAAVGGGAFINLGKDAAAKITGALLTPAGAYAAVETVSTGAEIATGYDGPPILPGPGDAIRAVVQNANEAAEVVHVAVKAEQVAQVAEGAAAVTGRSARSVVAKSAGEIEWVKETVTNPRAAAYERGAAGAVEGKAPRLSALDGDGKTVTAKFDGVEGNVMVDRKLAVTTFDKSKKQALRQNVVAAENGKTVRWEVPNEKEAGRAETMFKELGTKHMESKVVPEEK